MSAPSNGLPQLPAEISPDGREVWDWAARLSDEVQRREEIRALAVQIRNMETQCGNCADWMTRACPREQHSNTTGRSTGPSSQSVKCQQFHMTAFDAQQLDAAKARLEAMHKRGAA